MVEPRLLLQPPRRLPRQIRSKLLHFPTNLHVLIYQRVLWSACRRSELGAFDFTEIAFRPTIGKG
jgi:hypothetical protein